MISLPIGYKLIRNFEDILILAQFESIHPEPYVIWKMESSLLYEGVYFSNPKEAMDAFNQLTLSRYLKHDTYEVLWNALL